MSISREWMREEAERRQKYEADAQYEVWRSGGNPDRIDEGAMESAFENYIEAEDFAHQQVRRQHPKESSHGNE